MMSGRLHRVDLLRGEYDDMCGGSPLITGVLFFNLYFFLVKDVGEIHRVEM